MTTTTSGDRTVGFRHGGLCSAARRPPPIWGLYQPNENGTVPFTCVNPALSLTYTVVIMISTSVRFDTSVYNNASLFRFTELPDERNSLEDPLTNMDKSRNRFLLPTTLQCLPSELYQDQINFVYW